MKYHTDTMQSGGNFNRELVGLIDRVLSSQDDRPAVSKAAPKPVEPAETAIPRLMMVFEQPTPIPDHFHARLVRKRGRGRRGFELKTGVAKLPERHAKGLRDRSRDDIALPVDLADDSGSLSVRSGETSLLELDAGSDPAQAETWQDLV